MSEVINSYKQNEIVQLGGKSSSYKWLKVWYILLYVLPKFVFLMYCAGVDINIPIDYNYRGLRRILFIMFSFVLTSLVSLFEGITTSTRNINTKTKTSKRSFIFFGIPICRYIQVTVYKDRELSEIHKNTTSCNWAWNGLEFDKDDKFSWQADLITSYLVVMQFLLKYIFPLCNINGEFLKSITRDGWGTMYIILSLVIIISGLFTLYYISYNITNYCDILCNPRTYNKEDKKEYKEAELNV